MKNIISPHKMQILDFCDFKLETIGFVTSLCGTNSFPPHIIEEVKSQTYFCMSLNIKFFNVVGFWFNFVSKIKFNKLRLISYMIFVRDSFSLINTMVNVLLWVRLSKHESWYKRWFYERIPFKGKYHFI